MKIISLIIFSIFPIFGWAQKGIIIPEEKNTSTIKQKNIDDNMIWILNTNPINCNDTMLCYSVKTNGSIKQIAQHDIVDFNFEPDFEYTLSVKEELKQAPISAFAGIYLYRVVKLISKKWLGTDAYSIPVVTKEEMNKEALVPNQTANLPNNVSTIYYTNPTTPMNLDGLKEEVLDLKKQIKDLKKQIETMQIQLNLQFKLFENQPK